jgi:hypothetical protein
MTSAVLLVTPGCWRACARLTGWFNSGPSAIGLILLAWTARFLIELH